MKKPKTATTNAVPADTFKAGIVAPIVRIDGSIDFPTTWSKKDAKDWRKRNGHAKP